LLPYWGAPEPTHERTMTMANTRARISHPGRATSIALALSALLLIALVSGGAAAETSYRRTFNPHLSLEQRVDDARTARLLAPWSRAHRTREFVMVRWLAGRRLLDSGDYNAAVDVLREAYRRDVGDNELLVLFVKAQDVQASETNRKAHLQHGHEGPGGTLRPEDVER
jgi:uncharacterized protein HemY